MGHVREFLASHGFAEDFREEICRKLFEGISRKKFIKFMRSHGYTVDFARRILEVRESS